MRSGIAEGSSNFKMKLYAGYDDGLFEYAVWANNLVDLAKRFGCSEMFAQAEFIKQDGNAALGDLCPYRHKVYRRDLGHDDNPWQAWKDVN